DLGGTAPAGGHGPTRPAVGPSPTNVRDRRAALGRVTPAAHPTRGRPAVGAVNAAVPAAVARPSVRAAIRAAVARAAARPHRRARVPAAPPPPAATASAAVCRDGHDEQAQDDYPHRAKVNLHGAPFLCPWGSFSCPSSPASP